MNFRVEFSAATLRELCVKLADTKAVENSFFRRKKKPLSTRTKSWQKFKINSFVINLQNL